MKKRLLLLLAALIVVGLAVHLHRSGGPGVLNRLRKQVHGE